MPFDGPEDEGQRIYSSRTPWGGVGSLPQALPPAPSRPTGNIVNSLPDGAAPPTKSDPRKQSQFNPRPPAAGVYEGSCQILLLADTGADVGLWGGGGAVPALGGGSIQDVGVISMLRFLWTGAWRGEGGRCFPRSRCFPEMKMKTQCPKSSQQALRRIACTFDFYKEPHKTSLTSNHVQRSQLGRGDSHPARISAP